jgi:hypothetical protein
VKNKTIPIYGFNTHCVETSCTHTSWKIAFFPGFATVNKK